MQMHPRASLHSESDLNRIIPDESELTAGVRIVAGKSYGFFTDTTLCIGCKACEVACKEWNNLPADHVGLTGHSYDNTGALSANTWRHVNFIEHAVRDDNQQAFQSAVPHRVRYCRRSAGHLQRLRLLRAGLSVRRCRSQHDRRQGP